MRFFWLGLSILSPFVLGGFLEESNLSDITSYIYPTAGVFAEIVFIALCVSGFVSSHKEHEYITHQKIRHDRDEDIKKWRKEFMRDSLDLYEMQNESLKRAEDLAGRPGTREANANTSAPSGNSP